MSQQEFDFDGHEENLERVTSRIAAAIVAFCRNNKQFHADDLRRAVVRDTGIAAPASADRVLRNLRQKGVIAYRVLSRRQSLYEVIRESAA